jgi:hypothetical protein
MQRSSRCFAEPGPRLQLKKLDPGSAAHRSASATRCAASGERSPPKKNPASRRDFSSHSLLSLNFVRTSGPADPADPGRLDGSDPAAAGRASGRRPAAGRASDPGSDSAGPDSGSGSTFGISLFALQWEMQREDNSEGPSLVSEKLRFPRDHCVARICPECGVGTGQTTGRDQQKWEPVLRPIAP